MLVTLAQSRATFSESARELPSPDPTGAAVDLDLGADRDHRAPERQASVMLRPLNVSPVPLRALDRRVSDGGVARRLQITQAEGDRIGADSGVDLVDKGFAGEVDLRANGVAQMRGAQGRGRAMAGSSPKPAACWRSHKFCEHAKALQ